MMASNVWEFNACINSCLNGHRRTTIETALIRSS